MNRNMLRKAIFVSGALGSLVALPAVSWAQDGALRRLVAEFDFFAPGQEAVTAAEPPGIAIYRKTVDVPKRTNTLYLTLSTTGDTHDGAASCFTALLDGVFFNPGGQGAARCAGGGEISVPGWITLLKLPGQIGDPGGTNCEDGGGGPGDCHDNSIYYQWCTLVEPGKHEVEIRMASDTNGDPVFIEQAHFYVDASRFKEGKGCVQAETPVDVTEESEELEREHGPMQQ
jgi:hypothetical protein